MKKPKILIIYTGGTIGMINDPETNMLKPFDFDQITKEVPELKKIKCSLDAVSFKKPIDSSNMHPKIWKKLGDYIWKNYEKYSGFVILHGSDTMAYTASALSFMFRNLTKPIIFTGSQLPIGTVRTDGKENLITAIEIAATLKNGASLIQEVAIYFENSLYRANRTTKVSSEDFEAFKSFNYPTLAEAGIHIKFNERYLLRPANQKTEYSADFNSDLAIVHLFPGINFDNLKYTLGNSNLKAIILLTFGSGNAPTDVKFLKIINDQIKKGMIFINLTQCNGGSVKQGRYETSDQLLKMGVIGAKDMTLEAVITKLMIILGDNKDNKEIKNAFTQSISGEIIE